MSEIPKGWRTSTLGAIAAITSGVAKHQGRTAESGMREVPYLRVANVQRMALNLDEVKTIFASDDEIEDLRLEPGDVLLNEGGDRDKLGRGWVWAGELETCIHQNHVFRARIDPAKAIPKFVAYYTNSMNAQKFFLGAAKQTTNLASISMRQLKSLPIPVPPLADQRRIAAAIEANLSSLDFALATVRRVASRIGRTRASILRAAVEGRLLQNTRVARAQNQPLPEGWRMVRLCEIADVTGGIAKDSKQTVGRSVPYLRVANVHRGRLDLDDIKTMVVPEARIQQLRLLPGDILLNEGGDRDKLGRGWVWEGQIDECIHQNHVFRARLRDADVEPRYISHYANTQGEVYFFQNAKQTTNLASISLSKVRGLPVALPPPLEQREIVAEIDRRFSVLDNAAARLAAHAERLDRARHAILKRAFEGRLVPPSAAQHAPTS